MSAFDRLARTNPDVATLVNTAVQRGITTDAIVQSVRHLWPHQRPAFYRRVTHAAEALHDPCSNEVVVLTGHVEEINLSGWIHPQGRQPWGTLVVRDLEGGHNNVVCTDEALLTDIRLRLRCGMLANFTGIERQTPGGWFEFVLTGFALPEDKLPHAFLLIHDGDVRDGWIAPTRQDALITARRWYAARRAMNISDDAHSADHPDLYDCDPDPATATIEEISAWYAAGDAGWGVQIAPLSFTEVVADCLSELNAIANVQAREGYRQAILEAVAAVQPPERRPDDA